MKRSGCLKQKDVESVADTAAGVSDWERESSRSWKKQYHLGSRERNHDVVVVVVVAHLDMSPMDHRWCR